VPPGSPICAGDRSATQFARVLAKLSAHYGDVELPEPRDPFEAIVWENAGYLIDDDRRSEVFDRLRDAVGVDPHALLSTGLKRIERALEGGGMQPARRAEKVLRSAELAFEAADGDLLQALRLLDAQGARGLLKRFPGIGDPGADKLMLIAGLSDEPALDSNGLRVLVRIAAIEEQKSYGATYRLGVRYLRENGVDSADAAVKAFLLLRLHGRELCKRSIPICTPCPLRRGCPSRVT
jgi:endonuclease III